MEARLAANAERLQYPAEQAARKPHRRLRKRREIGRPIVRMGIRIFRASLLRSTTASWHGVDGDHSQPSFASRNSWAEIVGVRPIAHLLRYLPCTHASPEHLDRECGLEVLHVACSRHWVDNDQIRMPRRRASACNSPIHVQNC